MAAWLTATTLWLASLIAAPYAVTHLHSSNAIGTGKAGGIAVNASALVYMAGGYVCHQRPERSFHVAGTQLPVCARCLGLYLGAPFGAALAFSTALGRRPRLEARAFRSLLLIGALPTLLTLALEWSALAQLGLSTRAAAAVPLGFVVAWVVGAAARGDLR